MKYLKYKGSKIFLVTMLLVFVLASCKKDAEFFEIEDTQGIDSKIWSDEGAVGLFLNRTYGLIIPQWPTLGAIHNTSDEMNNVNTAFLYGTLVENSVTDLGTANSITANRYFDIRRCNVALQGLDSSSTIPNDKKNLIRGQFYFLRAYVYFRMVTLYGGIPLVLDPQYLTADGVPTTPRAKTSECIAAIVRDLDSAAANLPATIPVVDRGRVSRGAALAVKGKVLMYWASPQFNPTNIISRWETAYQACKAAYDQCVTDGFGLVSNYANVFQTEDHQEAVIVRKYTQTRDWGNNVEALSRPPSMGGSGNSYQPTWNLVQAYNMNNGLPITHPSAGYNATQFWLNRDPRLDASIAYNGVTWPLGSAGRRQWQYNGLLDDAASSIVTGFYCRRFNNNSLSIAQAAYASGTGGGSGVDWLEMRFAEVMMNLAECANETIRLAEAKDMVRRIRIRAGIVQGSFDYGLDIATNIPTMRTLILNENQVEFALEGKRYYDLRRTRNFGLLTNRQSYKVTPKLPYVAGAIPTGGPVVGRIYLDGVVNGVRSRDTLNLNNAATYNAVFTLPATVASLEGSNVVSVPSRYYFYALPNFFSQSSFVIEQTQGWLNGTFDPLQ